ncbi:hypothetical protein [Streptomyces noursei]|uniref:hypothetical protein n=1 Tax=Streptomyces noursei TaxID=1971 RepID=UPI001671EBEB|nr:hypothetical protein [Streptomyces noursei]MCZ1013996.1 hypothetical protein [Streptomyces noursei]GGX40297.1 hypothetical protein GCM10010341_72740 [Streptomyces noursei]
MDAEWTIETICEALGNPAISKRFLTEINTAPAHQLLAVFAKWERLAKDTIAAVERGRDIATAEARGEDPTADWPDITDLVRAEAQRNTSRNVA